jgi:archaellum component FlaC
MTEFRKKKEVIRDIRRSFDAVHDIRVDFAKSSGKNQRIEGRITETTERIAAIESEINRISVDEGMKTVREMQSELAAIERDRDECTRIYAAMSMTASHVFRKSEKIAAKKHMDAEINTLKHTMELLSGHNTPDIQSLAGALAASCPIAERMIADGEIILKNKEERGIFSDSTRYSKYLCTKCGEIETLQARVMEAENALSSHPLLMRLNSLSREKTQLESMLVKEEHSRQELAEWTARTRDRIPVLIKELQEKLEGMTGGNVQLQMDNQLLS